MSARTAFTSAAARRGAPSIDVIILTPHGRRLMVLLVRAPAKSRERWQLPWRPLRPDETIDDEAERLASLRARLDQAPIAFHLLPLTFTLTQLQEIYELLLGRRLHKASFRRSLHAAWLVEPTDEWRSEGRGRPAQLFRYAPKKRRGGRRGVRFGS